MSAIRSLFDKDVDRPIEGVIKADDNRHLITEVEEYVITNEVDKRLDTLLTHYIEGEGSNGIWISGFFGSGKSHLLKMLSLLLADEPLGDLSVSECFMGKLDNEILKGDVERACKIPSKSVLFNIDQKADAIGGEADAALLAVFAKVLNELQGYYAKQDYIAQFEHELEMQGKLAGFKETYEKVAGRTWHEDLDVIDTLENDTFAKVYAEFFNKPEEDGLRYFDRARERYKLSVEDLADRVKAYLDTQPPGFRLNFFVDEVGQFVGRNPRLMLNLQTIAETLSTRCDNRAWVFVTSQGDLQKILGDLEDSANSDFSKIQGRFATRLTLSSADVAEVIQKRLLAKKEEQPAVLTDLYEREQENLRTLFTFGQDSRRFKGFTGRCHFSDYYPFQPYQFDLFQTAIERLSQHDAFTGKHASVGERSMLGVFQVVVKHIADSPIGRFATFDLMFEGLKDVLRGDFQKTVLTAEKQLADEHPVAVQILKCLFLLKWVTEFKPSVRNVAILLIDRPDIDIAAHEATVLEELNFLESQSYLQRNGELYEFLTDEEKDIEVEIKNTEIDESAVTKLLGEILFSDILKDQKFRYEDNKHDYAFTRKLDEGAIGKDHDLALHIVTPNHPNFDDLAVLCAQNTGRRELIAVLPESHRLLRDALLYRKTERYIQQAQSTSLSDSRRVIMRERGTQNATRRTNLTSACKDLLTQAKLILNGTVLEVKGAEPRVRFSNAFQELIRFVYPNLRMLRTQYSEDVIKTILSEKDDLLGGGDALGEAEQEILTRLNRAKMGKEALQIDDLLREFRHGQYGWYDAATLSLLARLFRRHKIEFRQSAEILDGTEVEDALIKSHSHGSISVQLQEVFDATVVAGLKTFHHDFFHQSNPGADAKAAANHLLAAFTKEAAAFDTLLARSSEFPFITSIKPIRDRIAGLADKDYAYVLKHLRDFDDDLLDAREEWLDPAKAFINGEQGRLYTAIRSFLHDQSSNLPPGDPRVTQLHETKDHDAPFRGQRMQQAKTAFDSLKSEVEKRLEDAEEKAIKEIEARRETLRSHPSFRSLSGEKAAEILKASDAACALIKSSKLIPVIRDAVQRYLEHDYPRQLSEISSAAKPVDVTGNPLNDGDDGVKTSAPTASVFVSMSQILSETQFEKNVFTTSSDVEAFTDALKASLTKAVGEGKGITL
ncbi:BREX system P-loop protein BrxC [Haloferula sp.]|uniref:BREX system P-loop protein BrxC n=1 Tax=Haloferula sp. TaxID=2497595 RepID=UPI0032A07B9F